jgi:tetracycline repressor-like protein
MNDGRGDCTLTLLAGELSPTDEEAREDLCNAFLRWQTLLHDGLHAMRERGDLRPETDLARFSFLRLAAPGGDHRRGGELPWVAVDVTKMLAGREAVDDAALEPGHGAGDRPVGGDQHDRGGA